MDTLIAKGERETIDKNDTAETCSKNNTPEDCTKEPNEDVLSTCSKGNTPEDCTKEPNEDAMSKDDTDKLNVKVDTNLTETLAEAKSDTVENQEGTQDLGFDCKSRVAEKSVNSREKETKQEKIKLKDDTTDTDPHKMYRGNDQSHNADKRRGRFDQDKKREPGISGTKEEFVFFWKSYSPYSQWYDGNFTVNGITFNCAEQYVMYSKASKFYIKAKYVLSCQMLF